MQALLAKDTTERLPTGRFFLLMAAIFTVSFNYGVVLPLLPPLLERLLPGPEGGAIPWHTGLMAGVYMAGVFLFAPAWGWASDRLGRRQVLLTGLAGCVASMAWFGASEGLWTAYLARGLGGAFGSAVAPATLAYIADASPFEARARRFAWMSAAAALGFLVGPALGGWLGGLDEAAPYALAAAGGLAVWLAVYRWLPGAAPVPMTDRQAGRRRGWFGATLALAFLGKFGLGSFEVALTLQARQVLALDPAQTGLMFAECSLVMIAAQTLVFSPLLKYLGFPTLAGLSLLAMAVGLWAIPGTVRLDVLALWVGLVAAGAGVLIPALTYRSSLEAGAAQGEALGREIAAASLGQGAGSAAGGLLYGTSDWLPFHLTAVLLLAGLTCVRRGAGRPRGGP